MNTINKHALLLLPGDVVWFGGLASGIVETVVRRGGLVGVVFAEPDVLDAVYDRGDLVPVVVS